MCVPKSCPDQIPNGALSEPCSAKVGSTCQYTCDSEYSQVYKNIFCETSTNWSVNPHALCKHNSIEQCPYLVRNGDLDLSCKRLPGHTCTFSCREGYTVQTENSVYCDYTPRWSQSLGSACKRIVCPLSLTHGNISSSCPREYGHACYNYDCDPGYVKPPFPPGLTCNASLEWQWSKSGGQPCFLEEGLCPSRIRNGNVLWTCHRQPGVMCTYSCDPGCAKDSSVHWLNCGEDGLWSEDTDFLCTDCSSDTITTTEENLCHVRIPGGQVDSPCSRRPYSSCFVTCDAGCSARISILQCNSGLYWDSEDRACDCSDPHYPDPVPPSYSSPTGQNAPAMIAGIVGAVVPVVLAIVVCIVCTRKRSCRNTTRTAIGTQPIDNRRRGYSNNRTSYSRESSPTPVWITSGSQNYETNSRSAEDSPNAGTTLPWLTANFPQQVPDSTSRPPRYNDTSSFTASRRTMSSLEDPPPSYDEVVSNPVAFKV